MEGAYELARHRVAPAGIMARPADGGVDPTLADHQRRAAVERGHFGKPGPVRLEQVGTAVQYVAPCLGRGAAPVVLRRRGLGDRFLHLAAAGDRYARLNLPLPRIDRHRVVSGKRGFVWLDLGWV